MDVIIERAERDGVLVVHIGIHHGAAPERVVDRDEAARPQQLEQALVVRDVARLVRVDEGEVEGAGLAGCEQLVQGPQGRLQPGLMRASTPASFQNCRAIRVHSSLTSHAMTMPSAGSASATARLEYPV